MYCELLLQYHITTIFYDVEQLTLLIDIELVTNCQLPINYERQEKFELSDWRVFSRLFASYK